jgi:hypothetical protein
LIRINGFRLLVEKVPQLSCAQQSPSAAARATDSAEAMELKQPVSPRRARSRRHAKTFWPRGNPLKPLPKRRDDYIFTG